VGECEYSPWVETGKVEEFYQMASQERLLFLRQSHRSDSAAVRPIRIRVLTGQQDLLQLRDQEGDPEANAGPPLDEADRRRQLLPMGAAAVQYDQQQQPVK
jgi:hypothetical protein